MSAYRTINSAVKYDRISVPGTCISVMGDGTEENRQPGRADDRLRELVPLCSSVKAVLKKTSQGIPSEDELEAAVEGVVVLRGDRFSSGPP
jgi:hypothetical protein